MVCEYILHKVSHEILALLSDILRDHLSNIACVSGAYWKEDIIMKAFNGKCAPVSVEIHCA